MKIAIQGEVERGRKTGMLLSKCSLHLMITIFTSPSQHFTLIIIQSLIMNWENLSFVFPTRG